LGINKTYPIIKDEKGITINYPEELKTSGLKHALVFKLIK